jgi:hypothetical protein
MNKKGNKTKIASFLAVFEKTYSKRIKRITMSFMGGQTFNGK